MNTAIRGVISIQENYDVRHLDDQCYCTTFIDDPHRVTSPGLGIPDLHDLPTDGTVIEGTSRCIMNSVSLVEKKINRRCNNRNKYSGPVLKHGWYLIV